MKIQTSLLITLLVGALNTGVSFAADSVNTDDTVGISVGSETTAAAVDTAEQEDAFGRGGGVVVGGRVRPPVVRPIVRPIVRPPGRVYNPIVIRGPYPYRRWDHPVFVRPLYYFNWAALRLVTCVAEDSIGYQFPVTVDSYVGFAYQGQLASIEDAALDRCFQETNGDATCRLVSCTPGY